MSAWTSTELDKIGRADELEIQSRRRDGTLRSPVTIWVARAGDDLYVRSVNGRESGWFRGTQVRHDGRIKAGGVEKDVTFEEADATTTDQVDRAYREKYRRYAASIVKTVLTPQARAATLRLVPRG
ncbi:MAG TPA: DUF2255 family protein [Methylomirabilota bacterium]|nr:DUF2255 family protein [Methylomirabilota bacterium]